jgi:hypothetical protein
MQARPSDFQMPGPPIPLLAIAQFAARNQGTLEKGCHITVTEAAETYDVGAKSPKVLATSATTASLERSQGALSPLR